MLGEVAKTVGTILLTYSLHYVSTKMYSEFCVPDGVWGYVQGFLTTGSPLCSSTLTYASSTQNSYGTIITMAVSRLFIDVAAVGLTGAPVTDKVAG